MRWQTGCDRAGMSLSIVKFVRRSLFLCPALMLLSQLPVRADQGVTLTWNPGIATNVAGYKIYAGTASLDYSNTNVVGTATNATISGLVAGKTYYFAAKTYDSAGNESSYSSEVTYVVPATKPPGLNPVTGLSVTANPALPNSVILSWSPSTDAGVAGYGIFYGTAPGNYSLSKNVGLVNSLVLTGLVAGSTIYFAMKEHDTAWNQSGVSAEAHGVVVATPAVTVTPPASTLTAPVQTNGRFSFTVSGVNGSQYVVQASTDLINWVAVQTNTAPFTFTDTNTAAFSHRYYRTYYLSP